MTGHVARILLVDDRLENLLALEALLEPLGQELVRATSGEEALRQLLSGEFAVILLDVQMPGMSGFETAEIIKSRERTRHIPIIFLTAISKSEEFVYRGYSVGAVDYMSKPIEPEVLRSKVAVFVDLFLKDTRLREQEKQLREIERREMEVQHMRELWESEARLAEIVGTARDAIITFDEQFMISVFNHGAERTFGRSARETIGTSVLGLIHSDSRERFRDSVLQLGRPEVGTSMSWSASGDDADESILHGCRFDGQEFPMEATVSRLKLQKGALYTVIARDVSERRRAEIALRVRTAELARTTAELEARKQELERAITARSRFYASMSHELRTPINAILGYSSLMLDNVYGSLNEKQINGIERTNRAARHLLELVNDVLDLSKIEAGKLELQLEPVQFPSLIEDLFVTVRPLADEHGCELTLSSDGAATIVSDPRRVRQIVLNLLSNAIKFGGGNPVEVKCRRLDDGGVELDVIDRGVGIAAENLDKIFDEFVQIGRAQKLDGTGLGLPISQRLATLLNGSLTVESEVDVGSVFRLRLPRMTDLEDGAPQSASFPRKAERPPAESAA